jgi:hypothetical protein
MPTNKQKKIKKGYSPKNFKKKLLSYQPQFSNAMKSVSGILSSHMQTASEMFDTSSNKKKYSLKIDKITNEKSAKKGKGKISVKKILVKKSSNKNSEITKKGKKKEMKNLPSINEKIKTKENEIKSKKSSLSTPMIKDMILSEDKMIEKLRMKVIWGLLHTLKVARNLKKIGLMKVGLNDFNCVLLKKEFDKREKEKNDEKKKEIDNIIQNKSKIEVKSKELKKQIEVKKLKKSNENYKSLSPQISIPSEPELITNLENLSFTKQDEKDLDSSIYHHLRYDDVGDKKEIQFSSTIIENESNNGNENENNSFTSSSLKQSRIREILITYSLNELSQKSLSDISEIVQYS